MAKPAPGGYLQFNFLVDLNDGTNGPHAGFQECSNLGPTKSREVTLKRGVIVSSQLSKWFTEARDVQIRLQGEDHTVVQTWKLRRARIIKHTSGRLNAKGTDVAMEELTLAYERLEIS